MFINPVSTDPGSVLYTHVYNCDFNTTGMSSFYAIFQIIIAEQMSSVFLMFHLLSSDAYNIIVHIYINIINCFGADTQQL